MRHFAIVLSALGSLFLAACSVPPDPAADPAGLAYDPHEGFNRGAHSINKAVDKAAFGPVARAYGTIPAEGREVVTDFRDNWRLPGHTIQYALQGQGVEAAKAATRFAVNTLLGLGGLLDPATEMGLPYRWTGFDETFATWGVPDGGYVELPLGGPGTERDWTGWALDLALDPTWFVLTPVANDAVLVAGAADIVNDRYELDPVVDELLYRSEDSYSAQRLSYLQNKRARLAGGTDVNQLEDVYADY